MPKKIKVTLRKLNPEAAEMWAYDMNGDLTPDVVSAYDTSYAYFRCLRNSKHVFRHSISKMTSPRTGKNVGCIYCGEHPRVAFPGETDIFTVCPQAKDMWDYERNRTEYPDLTPENLLPKSSKKAYFRCGNGHSIERKISDFVRSPECPECRKKSSSLQAALSQTATFWNSERNDGTSPADVMPSHDRTIFLKCPSCGYEWSEQVSNWSKRGYCKCCGYDGTDGSQDRNADAVRKNHIVTFRMANPEMTAMWDYVRNDPETPDSILSKSDKKVFFTCPHGHAFSMPAYRTYNTDGNPKGCPVCRNRGNLAHNGIDDFFTVVPLAKEMWDYDSEGNKMLDPYTLKAQSGVKADFVCENGHHFSKRIQAFTLYPYCPKCNYYEKHSITVTRPDMLKFWDYDANDLSPDEISPYDKRNAFWICQKCGYKWEQRISDRETATAGVCPSCDLHRTSEHLPADCTFRVKNPEASKLWVDELNNGMTPDNTPSGSGKEVYLRCSGGHIYRKKPVFIPDYPPYGCPECLKLKHMAVRGKTDLFTVLPAAKDMWDYDRNRGYDTSSIYTKSSDVVYWKCDKGHSFQRSIFGFVASQNCPVCKEESITRVAAIPKLVAQWDFKENRKRGLDINIVPASSNEVAHWRCRTCKFEWDAQISSRFTSTGQCPACELRAAVQPGATDLFSLVPELKEQYAEDRNCGVDTDTLSVTSQNKIWWRCPVCNHEWEASPNGRVVATEDGYRIRSCPVCAGLRRVRPYSDDYPELAERFLPENGVSFDELRSKDLRSVFLWHCNICGKDFEQELQVMIRSVQKGTYAEGCPYCAGKAVDRDDSFAAKHPELMDEYAPDNDIDPYTVTVHSGRVVKWVCRNFPNDPAHKWESSFYTRANGMGKCPVCGIRSDGESLKITRPDLEQYYDADKNPRPFIGVSKSFRDKLWWICDRGHHFQLEASSMCRHDEFFCPVCSMTQLLTGANDLKTLYPEIAELYDCERNENTPDHVIANESDNSVWWICKDDATHHYQRAVNAQVRNGGNCPICENRVLQKGVNDLETAYPWITNLWDYDKNDQGPSEYSMVSHSTAFFKCGKGHTYNARIMMQIEHGDSCLVCENAVLQKGVNSAADLYPADIFDEWSANNESRPAEILGTLKKLFLWKCKECGHEYHMAFNDRTPEGNDCPYCNNRLLYKGMNDFATVHPELVDEYSHNNDLQPDEIVATRTQSVMWICPVCGGEYAYPLNRRVKGDDSCPYCKNIRVLEGLNDFATIHPELLDEYSANNEIPADEILFNRVQRVLWQCPDCGGEYIYPLNQRKLGDDSCPFCRGTKVLPGHNSFKALHPDLMEDWSFVDNYMRGIDPDLISDKSQVKVWWQCNKHNKRKIYPMTVYSKVLMQRRHKISCPFCKGYRIMRRIIG